MTSRWLGNPLYHEATVENNPVLISQITPEVEHLVRLILGDPTIKVIKKDAPVNTERVVNITA